MYYHQFVREEELQTDTNIFHMSFSHLFHRLILSKVCIVFNVLKFISKDPFVVFIMIPNKETKNTLKY